MTKQATSSDALDLIDSRVAQVVAAASDLKAIDLRVLDVESTSDVTDYFLICSGASDRQVKAIADSVLRSLRDVGSRPLHREGYTYGRWVLLDYGDFVVHVFDPETREYYALERLWNDAPEVTQRFLNEPTAAERSD